MARWDEPSRAQSRGASNPSGMNDPGFGFWFLLLAIALGLYACSKF
jgi:hypothetical protein